MATVAARATRLPIYSSFAKEGNLSDLYAKGEAISTVFNVVGLGVGIQLVSTVCSSMQGKVYIINILQTNWFVYFISLLLFCRWLLDLFFLQYIFTVHMKK